MDSWEGICKNQVKKKKKLQFLKSFSKKIRQE